MAYISDKENISLRYCDTDSARLHDHGFLELAYVTSGSASHEINSEKMTINKGDYFFVDFGSYHAYERSSDQRFAVINCLFNPAFIDKSLTHCRSFADVLRNYLIRFNKNMMWINPSDYIFHDDNGVILRLMNDMISEYDQKSTGYLELLRCKLVEAIIYTMRNYCIGGAGDYDGVSRYIIDEINRNYMTGVNLYGIAAELSYSASYLSRKFKEDTGKSFSEYLQGVRLEHSCRLLANTDKKIFDIAAAVGYGNVNFFGYLFKKSYGMSPSEFRKRSK